MASRAPEIVADIRLVSKAVMTLTETSLRTAFARLNWKLDTFDPETNMMLVYSPSGRPVAVQARRSEQGVNLTIIV